MPHGNETQGERDGAAGPLDARAAARASLAAGRSPTLWWITAGLAVSVVLVVVRGVPVGALALAVMLAIAGAVRALLPAPRAAALTVRSRTLDVAILFSLAIGIGVLSQIIPTR
ncbi:DUF3017 domain-containing protein [Pengzhenrongella frigida]|uniref:DUF3017 domain-containing protein n=1 Tax=Pengzhenrongella frigida TaxID=1259133 RepID=A0A4Q5N247_9MICO|nr:DUF3017 domain-containing protein [Cellulomonas sp. HLT2-17]RYV52238.1 DUF3017 domain-containing protein [Cellulomonas sp. HLT2-17]